ncbi:Tlg2-vesicle protein, partial [Podila epigama]
MLVLAPAVDYIRKSDYGMLVMGSILCATCYGVVSMICGFIFGFPKGFIPAFCGDLVGASLGFFIYRFAFSGYIRRKFQDSIEYQELVKAVNKDGFIILFMIRISSFPFALLNAIFGAMTMVPYWKFILATTLSTPRLLLAIYIGHNISSLADPEIKGTDRTLKWIANFAGAILALAVGWYIYRLATKKIHAFNAQSAEEEAANNAYMLQQQQQIQHQQFQLNQQNYSDGNNGYGAPPSSWPDLSAANPPNYTTSHALPYSLFVPPSSNTAYNQYSGQPSSSPPP